jgi:2,3-bisphosphoglycerate-independent phosphoglycerate mutase
LRACTDLWPFWPGIAPTGLVSFAERYGKTAALSSGVDLLGGLAELFGLERLEIAGVTDGLDNDFAAQATGSLDALDDHDLVVIHIEAPDEEGHAGNIFGKIAALEKIDSQVMTRILTYAKQSDEGVRVLALPDHPTPIELMTHTGDPVPWLLWGTGIKPAVEPVEAYNEFTAADAGTMIDPGAGLMELLLADKGAGPFCQGDSA